MTVMIIIIVDLGSITDLSLHIIQHQYVCTMIYACSVPTLTTSMVWPRYVLMDSGQIFVIPVLMQRLPRNSVTNTWE